MNKRLQLVLPSKLVPAVLEGSHSSLVGGHMGAKKTLDKVRWGRGKILSSGMLFVHLAAQEKHPSQHPVCQCNLIKWKDLSNTGKIFVFRTSGNTPGNA